MGLTVAKFGGSSVGSSEAMRRSAEIVSSDPSIRLVVLSALFGTTDALEKLAEWAPEGQEKELTLLIESIEKQHWSLADELSCREEIQEKFEELFRELTDLVKGMSLLKECSKRTRDQLLSIGERLSTLLFAALLNSMGVQAQWVDVRKVMVTNTTHGQAEPLLTEVSSRCSTEIWPLLESDKIVVTQGFIGATEERTTTTLGRGGSDFSAAILAEGLAADELQIWTDVPGILSSDPRIISSVRSIPEISFAEAAELATFGAKVLHPATLWPAVRSDIPIRVASSKEPEKSGTWIYQKVKEQPNVRAIAVRRKQVLLTVVSLKMYQARGFLARLFQTLADHEISVDLVTTSEVSVALTVNNPDSLSNALMHDLRAFAELHIDRDLALIAIIGNRIASTPGLASQAFSVADPYNVRMTCQGASEHNLCFLVEEQHVEEILHKLHERFLEGADDACGTSGLWEDGESDRNMRSESECRNHSTSRPSR